MWKHLLNIRETIIKLLPYCPYFIYIEIKIIFSSLFNVCQKLQNVMDYGILEVKWSWNDCVCLCIKTSILETAAFIFKDIDEMVVTYPSIKELMYDLKGGYWNLCNHRDLKFCLAFALISVLIVENSAKCRGISCLSEEFL